MTGKRSPTTESSLERGLETAVSTRRGVLSSVGGGVAALAGCLSGGGAAGSRSELRVGLAWPVLDSVDPVQTGIARRTQLFEPLVHLTHDAEFVPGIAQSWAVGEEDRVWTFDLDEDATFHDGSPVDATAVEWSLSRAFAEAEDFEPVPIDSVEATGDRRLEIATTEPFAPLLGYLTLDPAWILSPDSVDGDEVVEPIGAGPFRFDSWQQGERLTASRFDDYYGEPPAIERVVYEYVHDDQTRSLKLQNDELQLGRAIAESSVPTLREDDAVDLHVYDVPRMRFLVFNNARAPFDDRETRRAVSLAIDREAIVEGPLEGLTEPAVGPVSPTMAHWPNDDLEGHDFDLEAANRLLDTAGWDERDDDGVRTRDGERFEITLWGYESHEIPTIGQVLQSQLAQVGIDVDITVTDYGALSDAKQRGEFDLSLESWATIMGGDLDRMLRYFHSTETLIDSGYENERVDELIERGRRTLDRDERKELYDEIQRIVLEEVPVAFLTYYARIAATRQSVEGFDPHPIEHTVDVTGVDYTPE
ncbi:ABC transporter substrate-binding protein [Salinadaptatus halalkaliphilus]|uniref:ABC transporter substrate-binding protein n=1 Tax=Salinadaptatus halalkaliphilus TaxID=2419781 RepID=A0A4S3TII6_9EURY|nr:ABC transporter substrate-binding protein [Salinadaptatus halalkaliphilus]THE63839.1 ABC transporter substrate-binding protein [Salinadaptatus halalkaliphilus]